VALFTLGAGALPMGASPHSCGGHDSHAWWDAVAIKGDGDWSLLAQDSSFIFDFISKEFMKYRA
jgi:hypothetical protein